MRVQSLDCLHANDALMLRLVGKQRRASDIADGVNSRHAGAVERIDGYCTPSGLHADFFEAEILDIPGNADGGDDALGGERLHATFAVLDVGRDALCLSVEFAYLAAGEDL